MCGIRVSNLTGNEHSYVPGFNLARLCRPACLFFRYLDKFPLRSCHFQWQCCGGVAGETGNLSGSVCGGGGEAMLWGFFHSHQRWQYDTTGALKVRIILLFVSKETKNMCVCAQFYTVDWRINLSCIKYNTTTFAGDNSDG